MEEFILVRVSVRVEKYILVGQNFNEQGHSLLLSLTLSHFRSHLAFSSEVEVFLPFIIFLSQKFNLKTGARVELKSLNMPFRFSSYMLNVGVLHFMSIVK